MSIGVGMCLRYAPRKKPIAAMARPTALDSASNRAKSLSQGEQRYDRHAPARRRAAPATGEVVHATRNRCKELRVTVAKNREHQSASANQPVSREVSPHESTGFAPHKSTLPSESAHSLSQCVVQTTESILGTCSSTVVRRAITRCISTSPTS